MVERSTERRNLLQLAGIASTAAIAGCLSDDDENGEASGDDDRAIDPESAETADVLDLIIETHEDVTTYQSTGEETVHIEVEALAGIEDVDEQELLDEHDGVLMSVDEEVDGKYDNEAKAYEQLGSESGDAFGHSFEEDVEIYFVDGTYYEYDPQQFGDDWIVDDSVEFEQEHEFDEFADDSREIADELTVESRDDGDRLALSGLFSHFPEALVDEDDDDMPVEKATEYTFEIIIDAETGYIVETTQSLTFTFDEELYVDFFGGDPETVDGELVIEEEAEFSDYGESVGIEPPEETE